MLQIVALPVQLIELAPGPKYSTMAPVPPLTVSTSATRRMMSLGAAPPTDVAVLAGLDQVVAVHGGRHRDLRQAGGHELEERHLRGGVLHGDTIRIEIGVAAAAFELLAVRVAEVVDEHLLGKGQGATEPLAAQGGASREASVDSVDEFDRCAGCSGHDEDS